MDAHTHRIAKAWGQEIASRRKLFGYSRAELAAKLEVSREIVRQWEAGNHAPSPRMQSLLMGELHIDAMTVARLIDLLKPEPSGSGGEAA